MTGKAVVNETGMVDSRDLRPVGGVVAVVALERGLNMSPAFALRNNIVMAA